MRKINWTVNIKNESVFQRAEQDERQKLIGHVFRHNSIVDKVLGEMGEDNKAREWSSLPIIKCLKKCIQNSGAENLTVVNIVCYKTRWRTANQEKMWYTFCYEIRYFVQLVDLLIKK